MGKFKCNVTTHNARIGKNLGNALYKDIFILCYIHVNLKNCILYTYMMGKA